MRRVLWSLAAVAAGLARAQSAPSNASDKITSLPGFPGGLPSFDMYSGYLTVNQTTGKNLFYWFAESQNDPATDPLIVWFQGGPGCSSLLGFMMENGPLVPQADGSVALNPLAWNTFANTLYIDAPVGVGFSYSNTMSDYQMDNNKTADDNFAALELWLQRFPAFQGKKTWISGESYAGDYVPQVTYRILTGGSSLIKSQLTGFAIGNPVFSCAAWKESANDIQMELFYWHGMVPLSAYRTWKSKCATNSSSGPCNDLLNQYTNLIGLFDPDNIYTNFFTGNASLGVGPTPSVSVQQAISNYLNRVDVQSAIHAKPANWTACCAEAGQSGAQCALNYTNNWTDMLPFYDFFHDEYPDLRVLIYSGDTDIATCPHVYAQLCLGELNRKQLVQWAPWTVDNQTAGFVEVYDGYTYATVKGAGHEVPFFQPREAQHLISNFLAGTFP